MSTLAQAHVQSIVSVLTVAGDRTGEKYEQLGLLAYHDPDGKLIVGAGLRSRQHREGPSFRELAFNAEESEVLGLVLAAWAAQSPGGEFDWATLSILVNRTEAGVSFGFVDVKREALTDPGRKRTYDLSHSFPVLLQLDAIAEKFTKGGTA